MLTLNFRKTNAIFISNSSFHNTLKPSLSLDNDAVEFVENASSLGIRIQSNFGWDKYVLSQCGKIYACLRSLYTTASFLTADTKLKLFKSLILPYFLACDFILDDVSVLTFSKIKVALNSCVRYVFNLNRFSRVSHLQHYLLGCPLENLSKLRGCLFLHSLSKTKQPGYLHSKLQMTQSNRTIKYILPRHRTSKYGNSFFVRGVAHWNSLPSSLTNVDSFTAFKRGCIEHFN